MNCIAERESSRIYFPHTLSVNLTNPRKVDDNGKKDGDEEKVGDIIGFLCIPQSSNRNDSNTCDILNVKCIFSELELIFIYYRR